MGCVSSKQALIEELFDLAQAEEEMIVKLTAARLALVEAIEAWLNYEGDPGLVKVVADLKANDENVSKARIAFGDNFEEVLESIETIKNIYLEWKIVQVDSKIALKKKRTADRMVAKLQGKGGLALEMKGSLVQGRQRLFEEDASNRIKSEMEKEAQLREVIHKEMPEAIAAGLQAYQSIWKSLGKWSADFNKIASGCAPGKPEISTAERGTSEKYLRKVLFALGQLKQAYKSFLINREKWVEVLSEWAKEDDLSRSHVRHVVKLGNEHKRVKAAVYRFDKGINAAAGSIDRIVDEELVMLKAFKKSTKDASRYKQTKVREERFMRRPHEKFVKNQFDLHANVRMAEDILLRSLTNKREQAEKLDTKKGGHVKAFLCDVSKVLQTCDGELAKVEQW